MIVVHFFARKVRDKTWLYVETTCSDGLELPEPIPVQLIEVDPNGRRGKWISDASKAYVKIHPELKYVEPMKNEIRLESDHPGFDLIFRPRLKPGPKPKNLI